jgi:hypothetical protein
MSKGIIHIIDEYAPNEIVLSYPNLEKNHYNIYCTYSSFFLYHLKI